jgi:diaminohydroxyphosphoribosylaminopyrimidine deaminase/5-amino-6-(5-phosphoribosylamino)uracil reductase
MMTGYLPSSGGLLALERACSFAGNRAAAAAAAAAAAGSSSGSSATGSSSSSGSSAAADAVLAGRNRVGGDRVISFYKAWDEWGALSNFSPHPISMPVGPVPVSSSSSDTVDSSSSNISSEVRQWTCVEHFYQSQKFTGVAHADAAAVVEEIAAAESPEEAARIGRQNERQRPELVRPDWAEAKRAVMLAALRAKFNAHIGPRQMLLSTAAGDAAAASTAAAVAQASVSSAAAAAGHQPHQQQHYVQHSIGAAAASRNSSSSSSKGQQNAWGAWSGGPTVLVESSPHDKYWGQGYDGLGQNHLGQLLMQVREELLLKQQQGQQLLNKQQQQQEHQHMQHLQHLQGQGQSWLHHNGRQQQQQQQGLSHAAGSAGWQQQQQQQNSRAGVAG